MKLKLYFSLLLLVSYITLFSQITYVNVNATGANDGSSWGDAFTELESALDKFNNTSVFTQEEIWVAAGTYKPGGTSPDTSSTYYLNAPVDLFGGFSGMETERNQRDPASNVVTLSGDLAGDDGGEIDSLKRLDNARHILFIDAALGRKITVDGFSIEGGHTSDNADSDFTQRVGGGIISFSGIDISNCSFSNNYGRSGGSIGIDAEMIDDPINISNCTFSNNLSDAQSAGLVVFNATELNVTNCMFEDNITNRGCCYPVECENVIIQDCVFRGNNNPTGFGGGMFVWQAENLQLLNNQYIDNEANSAAGIYIDNRIVVNSGMSCVIRDCKFSENNARTGTGGGLNMNEGINVVLEENEFSLNIANTAGAFYYSGDDSPLFNKDNLIIRNTEFRSNQSRDAVGGALRTFRGSYTLDNCTLLGNVAAGTVSGGAIYSNGTNKEILMQDCFFGNNAANWGAGMAIYSDTTDTQIKNCSFLSNTADGRGGAIYAGFKAMVTVDNCSFTTNSAAAGGAISMQNDSTTVIVKNSEILRNSASGSGGAYFSGGGGSYSVFENCLIEGNTGDFGGGFAFSGSDNPTADTAFFLVKNSIIRNNVAEEQGGGVNVINLNGRIENCLIHNNTADGEGRGGAISHNAADSNSIEIVLDVVNSTMANNLGLFSSGISSFTEFEASSLVRLTNTLSYHIKDFAVEAGTPILESMGGNYSRDNNMINYFGSDDIIESDPLFVDLNAQDFRLMENSPCVNAGVTTGATGFDINGVQRDMLPDIGAYEWVMTSSLDEVGANANIVKIWPNPVAELLNIDIEGSHEIGVRVFSTTGQLVLAKKLNDRAIDITELEKGLYHIFINSDLKYRSTFIKL